MTMEMKHNHLKGLKIHKFKQLNRKFDSFHLVTFDFQPLSFFQTLREKEGYRKKGTLRTKSFLFDLIGN